MGENYIGCLRSSMVGQRENGPDVFKSRDCAKFGAYYRPLSCFVYFPRHVL